MSDDIPCFGLRNVLVKITKCLYDLEHVFKLIKNEY